MPIVIIFCKIRLNKLLSEGNAGLPISTDEICCVCPLSPLEIFCYAPVNEYSL